MTTSGHFAIKRNLSATTSQRRSSCASPAHKNPHKTPKIHTCLEPDAHNRRHGRHRSTQRVRTRRPADDRPPVRSPIGPYTATTEEPCRSTAGAPSSVGRRRTLSARNQAAATAILTVGCRLNASGKRPVDAETTAVGRRSVRRNGASAIERQNGRF